MLSMEPSGAGTTPNTAKQDAPPGLQAEAERLAQVYRVEYEKRMPGVHHIAPIRVRVGVTPPADKPKLKGRSTNDVSGGMYRGCDIVLTKQLNKAPAEEFRFTLSHEVFH